MTCSEPVLQRERDFLTALDRITFDELEDRSLALLADDEVIARFLVPRHRPRDTGGTLRRPWSTARNAS